MTAFLIVTQVLVIGALVVVFACLSALGDEVLGAADRRAAEEQIRRTRDLTVEQLLAAEAAVRAERSGAVVDGQAEEIVRR